MRAEHYAVLWELFAAEAPTGLTKRQLMKDWSAWLDRARAHRPRLTVIAASVRAAFMA